MEGGDTLLRFKKNLIEYLECNVSGIAEKTIKFVTCPAKGDFSIYLNFDVEEDVLEGMKDSSRKWNLMIDKFVVTRNIIAISLHRASTFKHCFELVQSWWSSKTFDIFKSRQISNLNLNLNCVEMENALQDLTNYRIKLLTLTASNLCVAVGFKVVEDDNRDHACKLLFTNKSNFSTRLSTAADTKYSYDRIILCGAVLNAKTKAKESNVTVSEYKRLKKEALIAEMENREDKLPKNVVDLLTDAVVTFDLVRIKPNNAVVKQFDSSSDLSDGGIATFVMYNYCRLNAIISEFETRVKSNYYPPLPSVDSIDFSELKEEKEWSLFFDYVLNFPAVAWSCVGDIQRGRFAPHLLCNFLHALSRVFSSYYRSTKILLDNQPHLLPSIFARMHLIKAVHGVFGKIGDEEIFEDDPDGIHTSNIEGSDAN